MHVATCSRVVLVHQSPVGGTELRECGFRVKRKFRKGAFKTLDAAVNRWNDKYEAQYVALRKHHNAA